MRLRRSGKFRQVTIVVALLALVAVAGCVGTSPQSGSAAPTTAPPSGEVLTVSKADQTRAAEQPAAAKANFSELSADRQDEFVSALEEDVREPTAWGPGTDIEYVRYDGTWYFVTVVIVN